MNGQTILGIDLGATNLRGAVVKGNTPGAISSKKINAKGSAQEVLEELCNFIKTVINDSVQAIGIGVPGLENDGVVYDVVNIPSWQQLPLQALLEEKFKLPVVINNDANCFTLGEFYFGKGRGYQSMIGLTIGTGLGAGIIINKKLFTGNNCGAGEFGMIDYLEHYYEYYASGQFFLNIYGISGEIVYQQALDGNLDALKMYKEFGTHLGNAIKMILYAYDVPLIVLGGWAGKAFPFFSETMWDTIKTMAFKRSVNTLLIEVSELENSAILGAAALYYDRNNLNK